MDITPRLGSRYSQHSFAQIPSVNIARSRFDRSFAAKDTMYFDQLTPILVDEILPGDTVNLNVKCFARLATQVVPLLDNMYIDFHFFFVPNRLVWDNWEKFNGAQDNPDDSTDFLIPVITVNDGNGVQVDSIYDHMGIPTDVDDISFSALPLRAYNLIYNEWYRDQNLQNSVTVNKGDGPDAVTDYTILKRGKRHDYFTSCLPWPQKGDPVQLPLGEYAPILGLGVPNVGGQFTADGTGYRVSDRTVDFFDYSLPYPSTFTMEGQAPSGDLGTPGTEYPWVRADLSNAVSATINQFRQSIMVQSLLELDARGGTRYVEIIRAHFNVISPDFRLQRPEYLSGGTVVIVQHPIPQTSATVTGQTAQANLAAFSTATNLNNNIGFTKSFTEHGYVIGIASARGDITYQQGLNRMWQRRTRYEFFWPKLQELGEQPVYNSEIYITGNPANDNAVFGYQERYAEYRYKPSEIRGHFRSTYSQSLDVWHLAEEFGSLPALNATFIQSSTPIERSLSVASGYPHLLVDMWFDYKHARPIMTYGVPATLGRF